MTEMTSKLRIDQKADELCRNTMREFAKLRKKSTKTPDEFYCMTLSFIEHFAENLIANTIIHIKYQKEDENQICDNIIESMVDPIKDSLKKALSMISPDKVH